jgi:spore protease
MERVNRTIQIGDTGISPGSGVGNKRMEISQKTLGVPVIAIGVPTVVDAATMANDTIDLAIDEMTKQATSGGEFYNMLKTIDKNEKQKMIEEILNPYIGNLMVTPKEVDLVIDSLSKVIANGINISLQPALGLEDINRYMN